MIDPRTILSRIGAVILSAIGAVVLGGLLLAAGYYIRGAQVPDDRLAPPDTDSAATATPDTSDPVVLPFLFTVHDTVAITNTRVETLQVPTKMRILGCFEGEPLRRDRNFFEPDEYTFTYFDPEARRYKQKSYQLGRPTWAAWPAVEIRTTPWGLQASGELGLRWRDWTMTAGYMFAREHRGVTVGLRWRPVRLTW